MARITELEGIGPTYGAQLVDAGITTTERLLEAGAGRSGRRRLARTMGISSRQVLRWVNMADLRRIKGVGEEFADLLEAAGVDTVPDLARRNAGNLHARLLAVNEEKQLTRRTPTREAVKEWISQASALPRVIAY